tara:strand:+ start:1053 stop:1298 length:246 start_codon:yes stop_codon:yes gene_type:complete
MKDTIKNSIIGAFAIFGVVALISSSKTAPIVIHEGSNTPESHVWEMYRQTESLWAYTLNKETGEVRKYRSAEKYYTVPNKK